MSLTCVIGLFLAPTGAGSVFTLRFLAKLECCAHLRPSNKLTESVAIVVVETVSIVMLSLACVVVLFSSNRNQVGLHFTFS